MIKYLHGKISSYQWFENFDNTQPWGVLLRKSRGQYVTEPSAIDPILLQAVTKLNVEVAFTMITESTRIIFNLLRPDEAEIMLANGAQLQVIDSLAEIVRSGSSLVKKFQYGALIRDERILLVWHDDLDKILVQAGILEERLLGLVSLISVVRMALKSLDLGNWFFSLFIPHSSLDTGAQLTQRIAIRVSK
jgi:hypothetical protein